MASEQGAGDAQEARVVSATSSIEPPQLTPSERRQQLLEERACLQQELELNALEEEVENLRRVRAAGSTPAQNVRHVRERNRLIPMPQDSSDETSSYRSSVAPPASSLSARPKLKEPKTFKGDTIKEARVFIRELEVIFALAKDSYQTEEEKVLYGVLYLTGDAHERWHQDHDVARLEGYTFEDFKDFVRDAVGDPVNRSISVTLAYDRAQQKDGQSVKSFASEIDVLEDQMPPYSEAQRVRHFLAKLKPALRDAIIAYHKVPELRSELVALATRIEATNTAPHKRNASETHGFDSRSKKAQKGVRLSEKQPARKEGSLASQKADTTSTYDKSQVECYGCHKKGHYKSECRSKHLWSDSDQAATRRATAKEDRREKDKASENSKGSALNRN